MYDRTYGFQCVGWDAKPYSGSQVNGGILCMASLIAKGTTVAAVVCNVCLFVRGRNSPVCRRGYVFPEDFRPRPEWQHSPPTGSCCTANCRSRSRTRRLPCGRVTSAVTSSPWWPQPFSDAHLFLVPSCQSLPPPSVGARPQAKHSFDDLSTTATCSVRTTSLRTTRPDVAISRSRVSQVVGSWARDASSCTRHH